MTQYPFSTFHFIIDWGGRRMDFLEVSGLTIENDVIEYRDGYLMINTIQEAVFQVV